MRTALAADKCAPAIARPGQELLGHLLRVAARASSYAPWAPEWAYLAGLWHDLGKYAPEFQDHLRRAMRGECVRRGSVNHSSAGAIHTLRRFAAANTGNDDWRAVALAILAHHGRLPDLDRCEERLGLTSRSAFTAARALYGSTIAGQPPTELRDAALPASPVPGWAPLFTRMLFSSLVDADRNDAAGAATTDPVTYAELIARFDQHIAKFGQAETVLNHLRQQCLSECLLNATAQPGCFTLDAPTGFAKTLAALGFALHHAASHDLDRIIYVAPFLTAIEQTAGVIRAAIGDNEHRIVLEHHSTADRDLRATTIQNGEEEPENYGPGADLAIERLRQRENWDAQIIVTSNVQFFESLHAHDAGRCRKLHRIARSVVLLDEPQSVPVEFMAPIAKTLDQLTRDYGASVVFVTATQPAFTYDKRRFVHGISAATPLLSESTLQQMRGVATNRLGRVVLPKWDAPEEPWSAIADRVSAADRATLCIVNTRAQARELYQEARDRTQDPVLHLSAGMCGAHRTDVLRQIRQLLPGLVKVVSTQVVEAGIDISFPHVMRAMAGLDSLIQSAGRCNRHGTDPEPGVFEVFLAEACVPYLFKAPADITKVLLRTGQDLFSPATAQSFYRRLRNDSDTDAKGILASLDAHNYTEAGQNFRLIEDTATVVVPYGERGRLLVDCLQRGDAPERLFDSLQGYSVSVPQRTAAKIRDAGALAEIERLRLWIAEPRTEHYPYHPETGLVGADDPFPPEAVIG
jgi:CRISPR-associated endonuclease/helicase Cas3